MAQRRFSIRKRRFLGLLLTIVWLTACSGTSPQTADNQTIPQNALRIGVSTNAPPLIYKQGDQIVGLEAELANQFAAHFGKTAWFVEVDWRDQIPALLDNRTDIIMSGMSITKMREMRIAFSRPYFRTGQMALVRKADQNRFPTSYYGILGQSPVMRFGVIEGTTGEIFVRNNFTQAARIIAFKSSQGALDALARSRIDIFIHDGPVVLARLAEKGSAELTILPTLLTEEYLAWGIRKNDPALLKAANQFLEQLKKDGRLDEMIRRWIPFNQ